MNLACYLLDWLYAADVAQLTDVLIESGRRLLIYRSVSRQELQGAAWYSFQIWRWFLLNMHSLMPKVFNLLQKVLVLILEAIEGAVNFAQVSIMELLTFLI